MEHLPDKQVTTHTNTHTHTLTHTHTSQSGATPKATCQYIVPHALERDDRLVCSHTVITLSETGMQ